MPGAVSRVRKKENEEDGEEEADEDDNEDEDEKDVEEDEDLLPFSIAQSSPGQREGATSG
eukprot:474191-Pyramimonas_sp.AAC.1